MTAPPRPSVVRLLAIGVMTAALGGFAFATLAGRVLQGGHPPAVAGLAAGIIVVVGILGLAPLTGGRVRGLGWASLAWASLVWLGLPLFTGEPPGVALRQSLDLLSGEEPLADLVETKRRRSSPPPPVAAIALEPDDEGDPEPADEAPIVLPYEGDGGRIRVSVNLVGPRGDVQAWLLFDTGATFTTLDSKTLSKLGLSKAAGPELILNTANGPVSTSLALLDSIELDGRAAEGVSIARCDDCSGDGYVGLLGLNVTGRYQVAIDHDTREVVLTPLPVDDRTVDISRWLELSGRARTYPGIKTQVEIVGANRSRRPIHEAVASVSCRTGEFAVQIDDIPAAGEASTRIDLPGSEDCARFELKLLSARW